MCQKKLTHLLLFGVVTNGHKKRASDLHRTATTRYRCFDQDLTEFSGSWSCRTYPSTKVRIFFVLAIDNQKKGLKIV